MNHGGYPLKFGYMDSLWKWHVNGTGSPRYPQSITLNLNMTIITVKLLGIWLYKFRSYENWTYHKSKILHRQLALKSFERKDVPWKQTDSFLIPLTASRAYSRKWWDECSLSEQVAQITNERAKNTYNEDKKLQ